MGTQEGSICFGLVKFGNGQGVDARELYRQLKLGRDFSTWLKSRIEYAQLVEGQDFEYSPKLGSNDGRGQPRIDYILSLDAAKHLAMLERNEIGRKVRQYFIEVEKKARQIQHQPSSSQIPAVTQEMMLIVLAELNERFDIGRLPELKRQTVKPREAILEAMKAQNETKGKSSVYLHYKLRAAAHLSANTFKVEMRTLIEDGKVMAFPRYHGGIEYRLISA